MPETLALAATAAAWRHAPRISTEMGGTAAGGSTFPGATPQFRIPIGLGPPRLFAEHVCAERIEGDNRGSENAGHQRIQGLFQLRVRFRLGGGINPGLVSRL